MNRSNSMSRLQTLHQMVGRERFADKTQVFEHIWPPRCLSGSRVTPGPIDPPDDPLRYLPYASKISIFGKVWGGLGLVWKMSGDLGGVFWSYLGPPSSHIIKKQKLIYIYINHFLQYFSVYSMGSALLGSWALCFLMRMLS